MPRKEKDSTGPSESFADWMGRVDRQVENAARRIERKRAPARSVIQNASIPLVVFEGATLAPELREKVARLTAASQKAAIAWAELWQQRNRWRQVREELIQLDGWIRDEYAHICRELNPEGDCEH